MDQVLTDIIISEVQANPNSLYIDYWPRSSPLNPYGGWLHTADWDRVKRETGKQVSYVSDETVLRIGSACEERTERDAEIEFFKTNPPCDCYCGCEGDIESHHG